MMQSDLPIIAATLGDPAGIGPEICVKAVATGRLEKLCHPLLIGSAEIAREAARFSDLALPVQEISDPEEARGISGRAIAVLDPGELDPAEIQIACSSAAAGRATLRWRDVGEALGDARRIQGIVHGPVNIDSLRAAGWKEEDFDVAEAMLLRLSGPLRIVPLTEHVRLRELSALVTTEAVLDLIVLLDQPLAPILPPGGFRPSHRVLH